MRERAPRSRAIHHRRQPHQAFCLADEGLGGAPVGPAPRGGAEGAGVQRGSDRRAGCGRIDLARAENERGRDKCLALAAPHRRRADLTALLGPRRFRRADRGDLGRHHLIVALLVLRAVAGATSIPAPPLAGPGDSNARNTNRTLLGTHRPWAGRAKIFLALCSEFLDNSYTSAS